MNEATDCLGADEPAQPKWLSLFVIVADHAGDSMPHALSRLGVPDTERHIACEIGIAAIARLVADALDATLVQQN